MLERSRQQATAGRVLHAFSPAWSGARAATVVMLCAAATGAAHVNIAFDGVDDSGMLVKMRGSPQGGTFRAVPVFDPLSPEERQEALAAAAAREDTHSVPVICEWPPMPAGAGGKGPDVVKLREELVGHADALRKELLGLLDDLSRRVTDQIAAGFKELEEPAALPPPAQPAEPKPDRAKKS